MAGGTLGASVSSFEAGGAAAAEETRQRLEARWRRLCSTELGLSGRSGEETIHRWWERVRGGYEEPWRHYHTLEHLSELFGYVDSFQPSLRDIPSVELAIFFHDIVYNPKETGGKNEDDSAVMFADFAQEVGLRPANRTAKVFRWIVMTKHHKCNEDDEDDCKWFMDFDMAVLGRERQDYSKYAAQVRQEFRHVPEAIWCSARAEFLEVSAASSSIFATSAFRERYEKFARSNLRNEAEALKANYGRLSFGSRLIAKAFKVVQRCGLAVAATLGACTVTGACVLTPKVALAVALGASGSGAVLIGVFGVYLVVRAPLIRHPYPVPKEQRPRECVYAGSFNPPHHGHLEIVQYLAMVHTKVHVVIGSNPSKKYPVDPFVRRELLQAMLAELGLHEHHVEVRVVTGYIWLYACRMGAERLYRGIRSWAKDGYEEKFLEALNIVGPLLIGRCLPLRTFYVQANPRWAFVSSTLLRECIEKGEGVEALVPPGSAAAVMEAYAYLAESKTNQTSS